MELKRSWPAVSQKSTFALVPSSSSTFFLKRVKAYVESCREGSGGGVVVVVVVVLGCGKG